MPSRRSGRSRRSDPARESGFVTVASIQIEDGKEAAGAIRTVAVDPGAYGIPGAVEILFFVRHQRSERAGRNVARTAAARLRFDRLLKARPGGIARFAQRAHLLQLLRVDLDSGMRPPGGGRARQKGGCQQSGEECHELPGDAQRQLQLNTPEKVYGCRNRQSIERRTLESILRQATGRLIQRTRARRAAADIPTVNSGDRLLNSRTYGPCLFYEIRN